MPMTFREAKTRMLGIYGTERYFSLYYELTLDGNGNEEQRCRLYVSHASSTSVPGPGSDWADNWEDAFVSLAKEEQKMSEAGLIIADSTGAPE